MVCLILVFRPFGEIRNRPFSLKIFSTRKDYCRLRIRSSLTRKRRYHPSRGQSVLSSRSRRKNVSLRNPFFNFDDDDDEKKSVATENRRKKFFSTERERSEGEDGVTRARRDGILSRARRTFARDERDVSISFLEFCCYFRRRRRRREQQQQQQQQQ